MITTMIYHGSDLAQYNAIVYGKSLVSAESPSQPVPQPAPQPPPPGA